MMLTMIRTTTIAAPRAHHNETRTTRPLCTYILSIVVVVVVVVVVIVVVVVFNVYRRGRCSRSM